MLTRTEKFKIPKQQRQQRWTIGTASAITGIPERTIRSWREDAGSGLKTIKIRGRIFVIAGQFIDWLNLQSRRA